MGFLVNWNGWYFLSICLICSWFYTAPGSAPAPGCIPFGEGISSHRPQVVFSLFSLLSSLFSLSLSLSFCFFLERGCLHTCDGSLSLPSVTLPLTFPPPPPPYTSMHRQILCLVVTAMCFSHPDNNSKSMGFSIGMCSCVLLGFILLACGYYAVNLDSYWRGCGK